MGTIEKKKWRSGSSEEAESRHAEGREGKRKRATKRERTAQCGARAPPPLPRLSASNSRQVQTKEAVPKPDHDGELECERLRSTVGRPKRVWSQKRLERKRWRWENDPTRRTPQRKDRCARRACLQTHRHRVSAGGCDLPERLSAPPPSDRKVRVLPVESLTHSGVGSSGVGGAVTHTAPPSASAPSSEASQTPLLLPGSQK